MPLAEILTPDGDGDEERGIRRAEDYANSQRQGTVLFADPHYREYRPGGGDVPTELQRKGQADRRNAASPTLHFMSGIATSSAASLGLTRRRQQSAGVGRQRMPKIVPGGGYAPPTRAASGQETNPMELEEKPREMNISEAARATGHLMVSHSSQPPEGQTGPEIYLG
jgi:hypothetical protein